MSETIYHVVIGLALCVLAAVMFALLLIGAWRSMSRSMSRSALCVFLLAAGVATVEAQKLKTGYVDASVAVSGDGSSWAKAAKTIQEMSGRLTYGGTLYVKPGYYEGGFRYPARYQGLHEQFSIIAVGSADQTIVEGGYIWYESEVLTLSWQCLYMKGFTLVNLDYAISQACLEGCRMTGADGHQSELAWDVDLVNCLIDNNDGRLFDFCSLYNCTLANNSGLMGSKNAYDSIFYETQIESYWDADGWGCSENCYTNDPGFVDAQGGDYHLKMGSPCINAGTKDGYHGFQDYDGNDRIQRGVADIGCYEYQPTNETQTITAPIPVEFSWLDAKCPSLLASVGGDYDKAVLLPSANAVDPTLPEGSRTYYSLWQSYLMDLNPLDSNAVWRATIEMIDGEPHVSSDPESPNRRYTVLGKQSLTDEVWSASCVDPRFFKVRVELK